MRFLRQDLAPPGLPFWHVFCFQHPMVHSLWNVFAELIVTPFRHLELIWGIVPLYFGLLLNEMTSTKASYRTAIQTGFSFLWAGAQWLYPYLRLHGDSAH